MTASGAGLRDFAGRVHGKSAVELRNISGVRNAAHSVQSAAKEASSLIGTIYFLIIQCSA